MSRHVNVRRTMIVEYSVPVSAYDGMTEAEIVAWESDGDNIEPETVLDAIVSDSAVVTFSEVSE